MSTANNQSYRSVDQLLTELKALRVELQITITAGSMMIDVFDMDNRFHKRFTHTETSLLDTLLMIERQLTAM